MMESQKNQQTEQINPNNIPTQPNPDVTELTSDELELYCGGLSAEAGAEVQYSAKIGPISVAIDGDTKMFSFY